MNESRPGPCSAGNGIRTHRPGYVRGHASNAAAVKALKKVGSAANAPSAGSARSASEGTAFEKLV